MNVLLAAAHAAIVVSILLRLAFGHRGPRARTAGLVSRMVSALREPALVLHGVGGLWLEGGVVAALAAGGVTVAPAPRTAVGAVVLLAAPPLMAWSLVTLRSWRLLPNVETAHELCTSGPYRFVRHPIYVAFDLLAVGSVLVAPTPSIAFGAALLVLGGDLRARLEERALLASFGDRYRDYMARVRRAIPGVY